MRTIKNTIKYVKSRFKITKSDLTVFSPNDLRTFNGGGNIGHDHRFLPKLAILGLAKSIHLTESRHLHRLHVIYAFIKCLRTIGAIRVYAELAERILPKVQKYGLAEMGLGLSRILVYHYGGYEYNMAKYSKYKTLRDAFQRDLELEVLAENHYVDVKRNSQRKKSFSQEDISKLKEYNTELRDLAAMASNTKFQTYKMLLVMIEAELCNDEDGVVDACYQAIKFFDQLPYTYNKGRQIFSSHLSRSLIRKKKYNEAEKNIKNSMSYYMSKSYSWARNQELLYLVYMRRLNIKKAKAVLSEIESMKGLRYNGSEMRDRVYLYRLYVAIMEGEKWGKVHAIINDLGRYSHDLKGMNMALVIAELIHSIYDDDLDFIEGQRPKIINYINKYGGQNVRSKTFIRLLVHLPDSAITWHKWIAYSNRMYGSLKKSRDTVEEIEIIDYEVLWPKLMERALSNNERYELYKTATNKPVKIIGL